MTPLIDFDGINAAALRSGRSLLQELIPGGKFRSHEYVVRNPRRDDQQPGSFSINYKTGIWKEFASGDGGSDLISLAAYVRGSSQGDAARELADKLKIPPLKADRRSNGSSPPAPMPPAPTSAGTTESVPKVYTWGDAGPPARAGEIRRHVYSSVDFAMRVKIKLNDGNFVNWYRAFADGAPAGWQARKPDDYRAIPYRSAAIDPFDPELIADEILWPEGERDVDSLSSINLPAFTFGGVADGLPGGIEGYLNDRHLVILSDNDEPGRAHAEKKAALAHAAGAASIRIIHFSELPPKGDVTDFIANGSTAEQLTARIDAVRLWEPRAHSAPSALPTSKTTVAATTLVIRRASEVVAQAIVWLWSFRIALGKLTLIAGDPGLGKSQLAAFLVAVVTRGGLWPCGEGRALQGSAVIFSAEDDAADTIVPRLLAAGADLNRVQIVEAVATDDSGGNTSRRMFHLQADLGRLESVLTEIGDVRLVIIDPITAYLGGVDTHRNSDVRGVLGIVAEMAARHRVAVVVISHWNKSGAGTAVNRVTGSGAFTAAVRAAFMVAKDPDDDERRLFIPMKNNLARVDGGLAFRVEQHMVGEGNAILASAIVWDGERVMRTADEILAATDDLGAHRSARDEAADWLQDLLANGPMAAKDIQAQTEAAGLSWATVRRAKDGLGIRPERLSEGGAGDGKWVWSLPADRVQGAQKTQDAHVPDVSTLQEFEHLGPREGDQ